MTSPIALRRVMKLMTGPRQTQGAYGGRGRRPRKESTTNHTKNTNGLALSAQDRPGILFVWFVWFVDKSSFSHHGLEVSRETP